MQSRSGTGVGEGRGNVARGLAGAAKKREPYDWKIFKVSQP